MTLPKGTEGLPLDDKEFLEDVIRDDSKSARTSRLLKLIEVLGSWIEREQKRAREAFTEATKQTAYWKELQEQTDKGRAELARVLAEEKQAKEAARTELGERMREVLDLRAAVARMQPPSDPNKPSSQPQLSLDEIRFLQRAATGEDGDARHLALLVERFRHGYVMQRERAETAEQRVRTLEAAARQRETFARTVEADLNAVLEVAVTLGWDEKASTLSAFIRDLARRGVVRVNLTPESMSTVFNQALMQQLDEAQAAKRELTQQLEDVRAAATALEARAKRAEQGIQEIAQARDRITGFSGTDSPAAIAVFIREQNDRIAELDQKIERVEARNKAVEAALDRVRRAARDAGATNDETDVFVRLQSEQLKEWGLKFEAERALALARVERLIARADTLEGTVAEIRAAAREAGILGERDVAGFITRQQERITELERDKTSLVIKLEAERQVKSRIEELEGIEREQAQTIATLQGELENARADYRVLKEDYDRTYAEAASLRGKLRRFKAGAPNTERTLVEMLQSVEALRAQVDDLRADIVPKEEPRGAAAAFARRDAYALVEDEIRALKCDVTWTYGEGVWRLEPVAAVGLLGVEKTSLMHAVSALAAKMAAKRECADAPEVATNTRMRAYRILIVARRQPAKAPQLVNEWVTRNGSKDAWETSSLDEAKRKLDAMRDPINALQIVERLAPVGAGTEAWMRVEYVADTVPSVFDAIAEAMMYRIAVQHGDRPTASMPWLHRRDAQGPIAAFDTVAEARARAIELNEAREHDDAPKYHVMKRCVG